MDAVRAFWDTIKGYLPNELSLTVSPVVDNYDRETAELIGSATAATAPAVVNGTSATVYAAAAGFKITWNTGAIANGRRVRGTTFVVPAAGVYDANGRISTTVITAVNAAAVTLLAAFDTNTTPMGVWSRPWDLPSPRVGFATEVTTGTCSAKTAILRGRRD